MEVSGSGAVFDDALPTGDPGQQTSLDVDPCPWRQRRGLGDKYYQAASLSRLGETYRAAGDLAAARASWRQALNILDGTQHPEAAAVRAWLADLDAAAPSRR